MFNNHLIILRLTLQESIVFKLHTFTRITAIRVKPLHIRAQSVKICVETTQLKNQRSLQPELQMGDSFVEFTVLPIRHEYRLIFINLDGFTRVIMQNGATIL